MYDIILDNLASCLKGEDPYCYGLFYSCGYNSAGMMLGGGCGEQIAHWIIHGQPDKYMLDYDIRRFFEYF